MKWGRISEIDPNDEQTWKNKSFLTLDIDWAPEFMIEDTLNVLKKFGVPATFFVTHESAVLRKEMETGSHEFGIHPNFNKLLNGDFSQGASVKEVIEYYLKFAKSPSSVRSHSMTQNSMILSEFVKYGLTHECNTYVDFQSQIEMKPWNGWVENLVRVPHQWEDDIWLLSGLPWGQDKLNLSRKFRVFDFHPVHIYLNSTSFEQYEAIKARLSDQEHVDSQKKSVEEFGVRTALYKILEGELD